MKQPFEDCKFICENEQCNSTGMCYTTIMIFERTEKELANKYLNKIK